MRKTFVIGDIHGCHGALIKLLGQLAVDPREDCVIFLGDYIDRGPDSKAVVDEVLRLRKQLRHCITLMGNHEEMLLRFLAGHERQLFPRVGGRETLASYGVHEPYDRHALRKIPDEHCRFFEELLTCWEDDNYIYVHAGLQPGVHLSQQPREWLLWAREDYLGSDYDFGKPVVSGHTPCRQPRVEKNKLIIDTGAVYGGRLTCLVLPDREFVQVAGRDAGATFFGQQYFL